MEDLLKRIEKFPKWKDSIRRSCRRNEIKTAFANSLTPLKLKALYQRLTKTYQSNKEKSKNTWFENQLRAYHWVLLAVSQIEGILIKDFKIQQWENLAQIFIGKELYVLEYEAIRLKRKKQLLSQKWQKQEEEILASIINQKTDDDKNKWNDVARTLFKLSKSKFYRTGKQCRQRWFNHLDPNKKHGNWLPNEDRIIAEQILKNGKKWSSISNKLQSRTEHMVKNRFKSLMIRQKKKYSQINCQNQLLQTIINENASKQVLSDKNMIDEMLDVPMSISSLHQQSDNQKNQHFHDDHDSFDKEQNINPPASKFQDLDQMGLRVYEDDNEEYDNKQYEMKLISPFCIQHPSPNINCLTSLSPAQPFFMKTFSNGYNNFFKQHPNQNASLQNNQEK